MNLREEAGEHKLRFTNDLELVTHLLLVTID